ASPMTLSSTPAATPAKTGSLCWAAAMTSKSMTRASSCSNSELGGGIQAREWETQRMQRERQRSLPAFSVSLRLCGQRPDFTRLLLALVRDRHHLDVLAVFHFVHREHHGVFVGHGADIFELGQFAFLVGAFTFLGQRFAFLVEVA